MDQTTSVEKLLRLVGRNALRRLLRSENDDEVEDFNEDDAHASPKWPHQQGPAHWPQQISADRSSVLDADESSDGEEQLQASSGQSEVDIDIETEESTRAQATSDIVQQPSVLSTAKGDSLLKHDMDFQQYVTADRTSRDVLPDVGSTVADTTTRDDGEKDLGRDIPSQKGMGDLQSLPLPADEVGEGKTNVQTRKREQEDSSDAEGSKHIDPPLPLRPELPGDDQGEMTDRSLATDRMETGQEAKPSGDLVESLTLPPDQSITSRALNEVSDFYKGRPCFRARVDSLPCTNQEYNIVKQLHGTVRIRNPLIIVGEEGCGKTTAALMLARHAIGTREFHTTYWYDSDHVSSCWFPSTNTSSLLVIDDFLGHCPSESFTRWRSLCRFLSLLFSRVENTTSIVMTSRTSVLQQFLASSGAEFASMFLGAQPVTLSINYRQLWRSTTRGIKSKTPNFASLPSIGFPLCCKLLSSVSQPVQKILFEQPRCALRKAVVELMNLKSVARTALALLAVTEDYLDTSVLLDPEKLQASQYWKPLNFLEKQPADNNTPTAILSFYEDCRGLVLVEDEFASFVNEAIRESVLVVLCESHAEFLSEFCSLKLLSQIALVTSDVKDDSDRTEKPVLPDCVGSAFLRRMITELQSRNYQGVFTCSLLIHASFQEMLAEKINQDLMTTLINTRDRNGLHFLFYAGAIDSVFNHALTLPETKDERMVLLALLACCYWNRADKIDGLWTRFKERKRLKKSLKKATMEQIVTGDLPGFSREEPPQWMEVPIYPKDTLVTMAAWRGNDAVIQNLAPKGINLNSQGNDGWTALMHYCARGSSKMTLFLLQKKADPLTVDDTGMSALMFALRRNEWDIPQELIDVDSCKVVNHRKESPLMIACAHGWSVHKIRTILSLGDGVMAKDFRGYTCLHHACRYGHAEITAYLLKSTNIDGGQSNDAMFTPLFLAATSPDQSQLIKHLLKAQKAKTPDLGQVLTQVCRYSQNGVLQQLFSTHPPGYPDKLWALQVASSFGNADIVQYLLCNGVSPKSAVDENLISYLHLACMGVSLETVEMLAKEVDCDVKMASGATPIMIALQYGRLEFVQMLHSRGASLNNKDNIGGCAHHAALSNSVRVLEWCISEQHMDVNDRNGKNQTPLFLATSAGRTRSMKWLLDHHADVTATDIDGNNCLHAAAQSGCVRALEILLSKISPGELTVSNHRGKTPLNLAAEFGHSHLVDYLTYSDMVDSDWKKY